MPCVIWFGCMEISLPEKLFYPVHPRTTNVPIFTSPVNLLVVLQKVRFLFKILRKHGLYKLP